MGNEIESAGWDKVTISRSGGREGPTYRLWFEKVKITELGLTSTDVTIRELAEKDQNMLFLLDALYDIAYPHAPEDVEVEIGAPDQG